MDSFAEYVKEVMQDEDRVKELRKMVQYVTLEELEKERAEDVEKARRELVRAKKEALGLGARLSGASSRHAWSSGGAAGVGRAGAARGEGGKGAAKAVQPAGRETVTTAQPAGREQGTATQIVRGVGEREGKELEEEKQERVEVGSQAGAQQRVAAAGGRRKATVRQGSAASGGDKQPRL